MPGVQTCKRQGELLQAGAGAAGPVLGKWELRTQSGSGPPGPGAGPGRGGRLALQLADTAWDALELSLPLLPPLHRGDHQLPTQFLSHDQIGRIDVIHLLAGALQAVFEPQHRFLQVPFRHAVQLVNGLALGLQDDFGISVDVGYLLHFYFQCYEDKRGQNHASCKKGMRYRVGAFLTPFWPSICVSWPGGGKKSFLQLMRLAGAAGGGLRVGRQQVASFLKPQRACQALYFKSAILSKISLRDSINFSSSPLCSCVVRRLHVVCALLNNWLPLLETSAWKEMPDS